MNTILLRRYYTDEQIKKLRPRSQADVDAHILAAHGATSCQRDQWIKNITAIQRDVAKDARKRRHGHHFAAEAA